MISGDYFTYFVSIFSRPANAPHIPPPMAPLQHMAAAHRPIQAVQPQVSLHFTFHCCNSYKEFEKQCI